MSVLPVKLQDILKGLSPTPPPPPPPWDMLALRVENCSYVIVKSFARRRGHASSYKIYSSVYLKRTYVSMCRSTCKIYISLLSKSLLKHSYECLNMISDPKNSLYEFSSHLINGEIKYPKTSKFTRFNNLYNLTFFFTYYFVNLKTFISLYIYSKVSSGHHNSSGHKIKINLKRPLLTLP